MSDGYPSFPKIPRLHRDIVITEKLDGTNGLISIERHPIGTAVDGLPDGVFLVMDDRTIGEDGLPVWEYHIRAGSRNRWLTPDSDNYGFSKWVAENAVELSKLGPGSHYGEWFGRGIQRGYGLDDRRFALFNVGRWFDPRSPLGEEPPTDKAQPCPEVVTVVPVLWTGNANQLNAAVALALSFFDALGSVAVPGYRNPEGLMVYHVAGGHYYKVLRENDGKPKGAVA